MFLESFFKKKGNYLLWLLVLILTIPLIYACGSNGGDEVVSSYTISGHALKGPIYPGVVTAYKIAGGQKDGILGTAQTDPKGKYSITFEGYTGPVILEVSGKYLDEATGDPNKQIDPNKPLHAMLSSTTGKVDTAITPLTEIAYKRATEIGKGKDETDPNLTVFDADTIDLANSEISNSFGIDIIRTMPVNVKDKDALEADANNLQIMAQIKYGLYLAAISKMADSNSIDPMVMVDKLADEIKDGNIGEKGETTLNDIGKALSEVADPNNNIIDPNVVTLNVIQKIADDQSDLFDQFYDPNDPNGVSMSGSPTAGESSLDQAKAMIQELRTMVLNTETAFGEESIRLVAEIESVVVPELMELEQMAIILGEGMGMILDDPNHFPDSNALLQDLQNSVPIQVSTNVCDYYKVTLELDFATGVMMGALFDPNVQTQLQDPNIWSAIIKANIDPNFPNDFLDPNEQGQLHDPNQIALLFIDELYNMGIDPGILLLQDSNILSGLEDPNLDVFRFEVGYTLEKGDINKGAGSMVVSLDRNNGGIKLLTLNGTLELSSGTASLTDCGISFRQDQSDPNITGMSLHIGKLQTAHIMADSSLDLEMQGGPFGEDIIGEGDLLALSLLSLKGSVGVSNSTQWNGEIRISEPMLADPNFVYSPFALPSKLELIGGYAVPESISFDGIITARLYNGKELYSYNILEGNPVDPNIEIDVLGELSIAGIGEIRVQMNCFTSAPAEIYNISISSLSLGGISLTGDIILNDTEGNESTIFDLRNQDGIEVNLVMDGTFTGTIMKDGILLGIFDELEGIPRVTYYDGYFETLF